MQIDDRANENEYEHYCMALTETNFMQNKRLRLLTRNSNPMLLLGNLQQTERMEEEKG